MWAPAMTFWEVRVGIEMIRKKMNSVEKKKRAGKNLHQNYNININNIHVSFLPSTKPAEVESIHKWCPEKLETKWPEDKAEEGLVLVADALAL